MTHREATAAPSVAVHSIRRRAAVRELGGDLCVSKVAMKPGKPLAAGRRRVRASTACAYGRHISSAAAARQCRICHVR